MVKCCTLLVLDAKSASVCAKTPQAVQEAQALLRLKQAALRQESKAAPRLAQREVGNAELYKLAPLEENRLAPCLDELGRVEVEAHEKRKGLRNISFFSPESVLPPSVSKLTITPGDFVGPLANGWMAVVIEVAGEDCFVMSLRPCKEHEECWR